MRDCNMEVAFKMILEEFEKPKSVKIESENIPV